MGAMGGYSPLAKSLMQALGCALILLLFLPAPSHSYTIYRICPPVRLPCGEKGIDSVVAPFRTDEQPESCGWKPFRLFCHGEFPAIQINSAIYWVKEINYQTRILTLVNMDFVGTGLCPTEFTSTTLDISPFDYNYYDVQNVTIRYNCSCRSALEKHFWEMPCPANASGSAFLAARGLTQRPYWGCICPGAEVTVALGRRELEELVSNRRDVGPDSFMQVLLHGFKVRWPESYTGSDWCDVCKGSGGACKYDRWFAGICSCRGVPYSPACPSPGAARWTSIKKVIIGTSLGIGGFLLVSCLVCFCLHIHHCGMLYSSRVRETRKKLKQSIYVDAFLRRYGSLAPTRYSHLDLERMTNSFSDTIGRGGFARVFKGILPDGRHVAVKVLEDNAKCNGKVFVNEVVSIGCTYHVNIVSLLGFCLEGRTRALIYEFMPNGSLERFVFGDRRGTLGWEKLHDIAVGIARGLEYLHRGCQMSILHFDIKPHNILLDHEFCPKISDFGLAKLCRMEENDDLRSDAGGTIGYVAPEVIDPGCGSVSSKSDVYSYGMMVLEMVGGRRNFEPRADHTSEIYYPHWMYKHMDLDGNHQVCGALTGDEAVIARRMIMVGLWCIQKDPAERPSIRRVVAMLEGRMEGPRDPKVPSMPLFYSTLGRQSHLRRVDDTDAMSIHDKT